MAALVLGAAFEPTGLLIWALIGLIAGFLADFVIPGKGFGLIGNLIVGLLGAVVGGFLANILIPDASFGFWGSVFVSFLGACIIFLIVGAVRKRSGTSL